MLQALTAYISFNHNAIQYSIITLSENTVCVFWCNDNILRWGCNMPTLNVRTQVWLNQKKCYRQVHGTTPIISRLMLVYRWSGSSCPSSQLSADVYPLSEQRFKHNQPSIIPCSSLTHHSHNTHTPLAHYTHTPLAHTKDQSWARIIFLSTCRVVLSTCHRGVFSAFPCVISVSHQASSFYK